MPVERPRERPHVLLVEDDERLSELVRSYLDSNGFEVAVEYRGDRVHGSRRLFGNVIEHFDPAQLKGPDGMKFGADGQLYVAVFGQGDITVLGQSGDVVKRMKVAGSLPTNLAFGPKNERKIYVTEVETGSVQILDVETHRAPIDDLVADLYERWQGG